MFAFTRAGKIRKAQKIYARIVKVLSKRSGTTQGEREVLGRAYIGLGRIAESHAEASAAVANYSKARELAISLPTEALALLANSYARQDNAGETARTIYLDYLKSSRASNQKEIDQSVNHVLETQGSFSEDDPEEKRQTAISLNQEIFKIRHDLEWPHYYLGLGEFVAGKYRDTIDRFTPVVDSLLAVKRADSTQQQSQSRAARPGPAVVSRQDLAKNIVLLLARAHSREREFEQTKTYLGKYIHRFGTDAAALYHMGCAHANLGEFQEAKTKFQLALPLDFSSAPKIQTHTLAQLGNVLLILGQSQDAEQQFKEALRRAPTHAPALYGLGKLRQLRGSYVEARQYFEQALAQDPNHVGAHYSLGRIYENQGRWEVAERSYRAALQGKPEFYKASLRLGILQFKGPKATHRHHQEGRELLSHMLQAGVKSDVLPFYLGLAEIHTGQLTTGLARWKRLQQQRTHRGKPWLAQNIEIASYLAGAECFRQARFQQTIEYWDACPQLLASYAGLGEQLAEAHFRQGTATLKAQRWKASKAAEAAFLNAAKLSPDNPDYHLGKILCAFGLRPPSQEVITREFAQVLQLAPEHPESRFFKGFYHYLQPSEPQQDLGRQQWRDLVESSDIVASNANQSTDRSGLATRGVAMALLGYDDLRRGHYQAAVERFVTALKLPTVAEQLPFAWEGLNIALARCFLEAYGDQAPPKARELQAIKHCALSIALIHAVQGRIDESIAGFKTALSENHTSGFAATQYAKLLCHRAAKSIEKGELQSAVADLDTAARVEF